VADLISCMSKTNRAYQRALVAAIESEMGPRRISRSQLARLSGMSLGTLDKTFWLKRSMTVEELEQISVALDVTPEYLATLGRQWRERLAADPVEDIIASADLTERQKQAIRDEYAADIVVDLPPVTPEHRNHSNG
jgi:hypothetical protein